MRCKLFNISGDRVEHSIASAYRSEREQDETQTDREFSQKVIEMVVWDGLAQAEVGRRLGVSGGGMVGKWTAIVRVIAGIIAWSIADSAY